jgi:hypothetical protein
MADLSGDREGLIPAYNSANPLNPCLRQNVWGKSLVTSIAVTHLAFLKPSLVAVRKRGGKPNGSAIGSLAYLVAASLWMQRRRHVQAFGVVIGAAKATNLAVVSAPMRSKNARRFTPDH